MSNMDFRTLPMNPVTYRIIINRSHMSNSLYYNVTFCPYQAIAFKVC